MYLTEDILACARDIRVALLELVGDQAPIVEQALNDLLDRAAAGEKTDIPILEVLANRDPTKEWAHNYLEGDADDWWADQIKAYSPAPGAPTPVPAVGPRYFCPRCGRRWTQRQAGEVPPKYCWKDNQTRLQPVTTQVRQPNAG